ncbi:MAG TPA: response regulator [Candidatus Saccharimonadales bacterium]|nr:response regulator [Candidatus Saccharimonadales bacterium]
MPKVLIIEDDAILQSAYDTVLTMEGYETKTAPDGIEGLRLAQQENPDVILLDMLMPNLNGLEFLKAFDAKNKHPKTKIIVFSNMSVPSDVKDAMQLGASKYLTKSSFTPKEMVGIIKEAMASAGEKSEVKNG